jgi:hypothetical protein
MTELAAPESASAYSARTSSPTRRTSCRRFLQTGNRAAFKLRLLLAARCRPPTASTAATNCASTPRSPAARSTWTPRSTKSVRGAPHGTAWASTSPSSRSTRTGVELCLFDSVDATPESARIPLHRADRHGLARVPARRAAGPALRLPGARALRPAERGTASTPPRCCWTPTPRRSAAPALVDEMFGYRIGDPTADLVATTATTRPFAPLAAVIDPRSPGATTAAPHAVARDGHLRGPRQGLHDAAPGGAGALRGTYAASRRSRSCEHLLDLGVTRSS